MEISYTSEYIQLSNKELNELDIFVKDFIAILKQYFPYVIISGYVAILFGRNRSSEDIDVFIPQKKYDIFKKFWNKIQSEYECINAGNPKEAYTNYLMEHIPIRFSKKNEFIPNFEIKFPNSTLDEWTIKKKKKVLINSYELFISPLELQIPYKLYLGSEKDIEDARFLYQLFISYLNNDVLHSFNKKFKTERSFSNYIL